MNYVIEDGFKPNDKIIVKSWGSKGATGNYFGVNLPAIGVIVVKNENMFLINFPPSNINLFFSKNNLENLVEPNDILKDLLI